MTMDSDVLGYFLHIDRNLADLAQTYPVWIYSVMFLIVFAETGLVVMGVLPGDSLIFAAGALAASHGGLDISLLMILFALAAFSGDQANYLIGRWVGDRPFRGQHRFFNPRNLERGRRFYARHGGEAVIMGRFIPVIRSIMPLSAAISGMPYRGFLPFSLAGAALWSNTFLLAGFFLGQLPWVRGRFSLVLGAVVLISCLPGLIQFLAERRRSSRGGAVGKPA